MALQDLLREAHSRFQTSLATVNSTLADNQVFREMAVAQARSAFLDHLNKIFTADIEPVAKSSGTVGEILLRLIPAFDQQRAAYLAAFNGDVDQMAAQAQSVKALQQTLQDLLS